jgi:hypothetical protein
LVVEVPATLSTTTVFHSRAVLEQVSGSVVTVLAAGADSNTSRGIAHLTVTLSGDTVTVFTDLSGASAALTATTSFNNTQTRFGIGRGAGSDAAYLSVSNLDNFSAVGA